MFGKVTFKIDTPMKSIVNRPEARGFSCNCYPPKQVLFFVIPNNFKVYFTAFIFLIYLHIVLITLRVLERIIKWVSTNQTYVFNMTI